MLKQVGTKARKDIENLLGDKVFLELWVKVQKTGETKKSICKTSATEKMNTDILNFL